MCPKLAPYSPDFGNVCVYACVCVRMCVCVCARAHKRGRVYVVASADEHYTHKHIHTPVCTNVNVFTCNKYMDVNMFRCACDGVSRRAQHT